MAGELERVHEILVPFTGELVRADDAAAAARSLESLRQIEADIRRVKTELTEAIVGVASVTGTKTLHLEGGGTAVVKGGTETVYDAEKLEAALRRAGMPESAIREIVVETVSYKVAAVRAKQAAAANPKYRKAIERHSTQIEKTPTIEVKLPPSRSRSPAKPARERGS